MELVWVGLVGAFGSIARFKLGKMINEKMKTLFPIGTFIINITGAILLGFISSMGVSEKVYLLLGDGFLGGYTTFSTFMYEGVNLIKENKKLNAIVYIVCSLILGIIGYIFGFKMGKLI